MARILIVDDNPDLCFIISKMIERMCHEAITASNGLEALQSLERKAFDIVITDIIMPDMVDGIELVTQICSKYPQMKVIAISGEDRVHGAKSRVHSLKTIFACRTLCSHKSTHGTKMKMDETFAVPL